MTSVADFRQCFPNHEGLWALPPDLKLVKLLVADVVCDVLHEDEDDGLGRVVEPPGGDQRAGQPLQRLILRDLGGEERTNYEGVEGF